MHLGILHYHFRPGGVRRVIELGAGRFGAGRITLITGEAPPGEWLAGFCAAAGCAVAVVVDPAFGYRSEHAQAGPPRLPDGVDLLWAHNLSLGRNLPLAREVAQAEVPALLHHHDWWFDHRWDRWPEMVADGFGTLDAVADAIFPRRAGCLHLVINSADHAVLAPVLGGRVALAPPPLEKPVDRDPPARRWRAERYWLAPCRLLRRKNLAEAVLLTRWQGAGVRLVTTGGVSSAGERAYAARLAAAAAEHAWPVDFSVMTQPGAPALDEVWSGAEAVVVTSLMEGFGLPFAEAAFAGVPLLGRAPVDSLPDLARMGFSFPALYADVQVPPHLYDHAAEAARQGALFTTWRAGLPAEVAGLVRPPEPDGGAVPFARLTLTAQLEVLAVPVEKSRDACQPVTLQPALPLAPAQVPVWPVPACSLPSQSSTTDHGRAAHAALLRARLGGPLYPLLLSPDT